AAPEGRAAARERVVRVAEPFHAAGQEQQSEGGQQAPRAARGGRCRDLRLGLPTSAHGYPPLLDSPAAPPRLSQPGTRAVRPPGRARRSARASYRSRRNCAMAAFRVAVIGGDGIGPEVIDQAIRVADAALRPERAEVEWNRLPWSGSHYQKT